MLPPSLVNGNYDCLWCLPSCLFYHQKGNVLQLCAALLFPIPYILDNMLFVKVVIVC